MRISSLACMKRFSKMFSVIREIPLACVISAMYCACMSVANPGYSWVTTSADRSQRPPRTRRMPGPSSILTPASRSFSMTLVRCAGLHAVSSRSLSVIAPAARNVPASMRSGMIECDAPCECRHSFDRDRRCSGAGDLCAHLVQQVRQVGDSPVQARHSSKWSGPSASAAAIIRFSVPVTVIFSKTIFAPFSLFAVASTYPYSVVTVAPSFSNPLM